MRAYVAFVGAALAAWWLSRDRMGQSAPGDPLEGGAPQLPSPLEALWSGATAMPEPETLDPLDARAHQANLAAFLDTIAHAEGTADQPDRGYRTLYAYSGLMQSYDDHPAALGWPGVKLTDEQCAGAGYGPGCVSTAAGRYQIKLPTWREVNQALNLPDFSPSSQDAAAVELIRRSGALGLVETGRFAEAVAKVAKRWASLPGANYAGQGMRALAELQAVYEGAGGAVVA